MTQSFNRLRQLYHGCRTSPCLLPTLLGCVPTLALYMVSAHMGWLLFSLSWCLVFAALEQSIPRGHPRRLVRELTPNFYAVRILGRRWHVFQRAPGNADCKSMLRNLLADQDRLPAALPPGRYHAITHGAILHRLQRLNNASEIAVFPAYTASMAAITGKMTAGRCKNCKKQCTFFRAGSTPHQFYDVRFTIKQVPPQAGFLQPVAAK